MSTERDADHVAAVPGAHQIAAEAENAVALVDATIDAVMTLTTGETGDDEIAAPEAKVFLPPRQRVRLENKQRESSVKRKTTRVAGPPSSSSSRGLGPQVVETTRWDTFAEATARSLLTDSGSSGRWDWVPLVASWNVWICRDDTNARVTPMWLSR
jgi:hypothetical protein